MRWTRALPVLLFLAAAAGTGILGVRIVASERASAETAARERLRLLLREAEVALRAQAERMKGEVRAGAADAVAAADGTILEPPAGRPLERLSPREGREPEAAFYLAEGERAEAAEGDLERAADLYRAAAAVDRDPEARALALHRLAALARRRGDEAGAAALEEEFLAALPEGRRDVLEALLVRARRRPVDPGLARDVALRYPGPDDPILAGIGELAGLDPPPWRGRKEELALRAALLPLAGRGLPSGTGESGDPAAAVAILPAPGPRGWKGLLPERPWAVAWIPGPDGGLRFRVEPLAALPPGVETLEEARRRDGAGVVEEHAEPGFYADAGPGAPPLRLVASASLESVAAAARRSARMLTGLLGALLLAGASAFLLSLRAARRETEAARARAEFVTRVGHDLRTPLAVIRMYAETLAAGRVADPGEARAFAGVAAREAERLTAMVGQVLDLSRVAGGPVSLQRRPVDLALLAGEVAAWHRPLLERAGLRLDVRAAGPLPVLADAAALRGAVSNLLENAGRHAASGGSVEVEAAAAGTMAVVRVLDRGPGLPPGPVPRLFERFVRGPGAAGSGAGLGLALVREAAEAHGGAAAASPREGGGAVFELRIPLEEGTA